MNEGTLGAGTITALLRACLVVLAVPEEMATAFRVRVPFWSVADALGRMRQLLAAMGDAEAGLETFLPAVPLDASEREQRCRAAVASTFVGGLELARESVVTLMQIGSMAPVMLKRRDAPAAT